ncbi:MAG: ornithine cyclodeaminase family protein [Solirubrobacterales bacterium]|nr:ornithine cyclodeaminase family protein [Solirubrobacterales bacterium]
MSMLLLNYDEVIASLSPADCAEAMAEVLAAHARGEAYMPLRSVMAAPGAAGMMGLMPAWRRAQEAVFALKAICVIPDNPTRGLDAHQGTVTLFDGDTGVPLAILNASAITELRTAAVSAVATRMLAREDARVLAILGAGVQGRAHLEALAAVRKFESVRVYSPTETHARELAARQATAEVTVAQSAQDAVRGADVVVVATNSRTPVLAHEWLSPGAHVNAVGASTPAAQELDLETVAASALFCDSRESLRNEASEFIVAVSEGVIPGEDHVRAELGEVLAGRAPGRESDHELTLFRSLGLAVEDLAAAVHSVERAREQGLGVEVEL